MRFRAQALGRARQDRVGEEAADRGQSVVAGSADEAVGQAPIAKIRWPVAVANRQVTPNSGVVSRLTRQVGLRAPTDHVG